ncbi:hypothetical protein DPEC_G00216730 [Dallia pectoralis]|uniref:Uncharacterized protein n=1 Tax=Dallia pectoralis TaxID=75939 RepID=A0ACC2G2Y9_DALPE|nr:hypothetical protein DPEC_G00216730 [Dallia pectoralis]
MGANKRANEGITTAGVRDEGLAAVHVETAGVDILHKPGKANKIPVELADRPGTQLGWGVNSDARVIENRDRGEGGEFDLADGRMKVDDAENRSPGGSRPGNGTKVDAGRGRANEPAPLQSQHYRHKSGF